MADLPQSERIVNMLVLLGQVTARSHYDDDEDKNLKLQVRRFWNQMMEWVRYPEEHPEMAEVPFEVFWTLYRRLLRAEAAR